MNSTSIGPGSHRPADVEIIRPLMNLRVKQQHWRGDVLRGTKAVPCPIRVKDEKIPDIWIINCLGFPDHMGNIVAIYIDHINIIGAVNIDAGRPVFSTIHQGGVAEIDRRAPDTGINVILRIERTAY
jgi:hypothetical protein